MKAHITAKTTISVPLWCLLCSFANGLFDVCMNMHISLFMQNHIKSLTVVIYQLICELFSLCFSCRLKDLNVSYTGMDVDQSVSLAFPAELLIINSVLADQRAVCCYNWPDREALPSEQLWLKLKPGFNPRPFTCHAVPSRRSPCLSWVSSCCALLDVTARQFRPFVHKSLDFRLQSEDIIYKYCYDSWIC